MKQFIIITILIMCSLKVSFSQRNHSYGFNFSLGNSNETGNLIENNAKLAFEGKVFYTVQILKAWDIRFNTGYSKRGFKSILYSVQGNEEIKFDFHYIVFNPEILFKKEFNFLTPYIFAGISADYFISFSRDNEGVDYPIEDMIKNYNKLHPLISSGAGVYFGNLIYLEMNYKRGILSKSGDTFDSTAPSFYDTFIGGTLGFDIAELIKPNKN